MSTVAVFHRSPLIIGKMFSRRSDKEGSIAYLTPASAIVPPRQAEQQLHMEHVHARHTSRVCLTDVLPLVGRRR